VVSAAALRRSRALTVALVTFATFTDIIAYSVAVPVLPDLSRKLGASPTMIGLLFASFGITLLTVSIPMGAVSDRIGRKAPLVGGMVALAAATLLFSYSDGLPWLFAARLMQGAADGVTWVVGFALIADRFGPDERGRVSGIVMSGTSTAVMVGPTIGGWLYELGGIRAPFMTVAALATLSAAGFLWLDVPSEHAATEPVPIGVVVRSRAVATCAAVVVAISATISMLEPVLPLYLSAKFGIGPARVGLIFGSGAVASTLLHPIYGRLADRWGGRRLMLTGLPLVACVLPLLTVSWSYPSTIAFFVLNTTAVAMVITPSLTFMAEAVSAAGIGSFGVGYGLYNMAWGAGLLGGPAVAGFIFERAGFTRLTLLWAPLLLIASGLLAKVQSGVRRTPPFDGAQGGARALEGPDTTETTETTHAAVAPARNGRVRL
jgi:MFS transporter, DHA1 family, solute carrier family 18 (vesicular amine transporter), member 1/2